MPKIEGLSSLRQLEIAAFPGLVDLQGFSGARHLEVLAVDNCRDLVSLTGPGLSPHAKLYRLGTTPTAPFGTTGSAGLSSEGEADLSIEEYDGEYYIAFDSGQITADEAAWATGNEPTGYFWDRVVSLAFPDLVKRLELDSEADMFSAGGSLADLEELRAGLAPLLEDPDAVRAVIESDL